MTHDSRFLLSRRTMLRSGAVAIGLPLLDAMIPGGFGPRARAAAAAASPQRMVLINRPFGTYYEHLLPATQGPDHEVTRFLKPLEPFRGRYTLFSGMGHPGHNYGHGGESGIFTAVEEYNVGDLHNTISLDQAAAAHVGSQTRVPCLVLGGPNAWVQGGLSWTAKGVPVPHERDPVVVFKRLFVDGTPDEVRKEVARLAAGRSILDGVREELRALEARLGAGDRRRLEVMATTIREAEADLQQQEAWAAKPKPAVPLTLADVQKQLPNTVASYDRWMSLVRLALQTDSTRVVLMYLGGHYPTNLDGLKIDHHDASHHGKDPAKVDQLCRYEDHDFGVFARFLAGLQETTEADGSLLDAAQVLFVSNLGDASSHGGTNLPVVLAGGGYRHRGYVSYGMGIDKPLGNLYVRMLRQMGVETERFGSSNGVVEDLG